MGIIYECSSEHGISTYISGYTIGFNMVLDQTSWFSMIFWGPGVLTFGHPWGLDTHADATMTPLPGGQYRRKVVTHAVAYMILWYFMIFYDILWYFMIFYDILWWCYISLWYFIMIFHYDMHYDISWYLLFINASVWCLRCLLRGPGDGSGRSGLFVVSSARSRASLSGWHLLPAHRWKGKGSGNL